MRKIDFFLPIIIPLTEMWLVLLFIASATCLHFDGVMNVSDSPLSGIMLTNQFDGASGTLTFHAYIDYGVKIAFQIFDKDQYARHLKYPTTTFGYIGGQCWRGGKSAKGLCAVTIDLNVTEDDNVPFYLVINRIKNYSKTLSEIKVYIDFSVPQAISPPQPAQQPSSPGITFVQIIYICCFVVAGFCGGLVATVIYRKFSKTHHPSDYVLQV